MPAPKKTQANTAAAIAKAQDTPKVIHVRESMDKTETVSEREWVEGQILTEGDDKVDYFIDMASGQKIDEIPLSVDRKDVLQIISRFKQDTDEADQLIVDAIHTLHNKNKGTKSVAIVDDSEVVNLANKLSTALATDLDEGFKAHEKTKYVAAELAFHIQQTLTEQEIASVPEVMSKRPTKPAKGDNKKYNKNYRGKNTGVDRGPPSYIGDIYDKMPDAKGIKLGQSILKDMDKIAPVGQEPVGQKNKDAMDKLKVKRNNGIKALEKAFKILQRFELLNEFKHVKAEFRVNDAGESDLQNLKPIRVSEVNGTTLNKEGKKVVKANQDWGWYAIDTVLNWACENLSRDTPYSKVLVNKTRETEVKSMVATDELYMQIGRGARYLSGTRAGGIKNELDAAITATDKTTGLHKNQALLADMLTWINVLGPLKGDIEAAIKADHARAEANEKDAKAKAKEHETTTVAAAMQNGHKTAA